MLPLNNLRSENLTVGAPPSAWLGLMTPDCFLSPRSSRSLFYHCFTRTTTGTHVTHGLSSTPKPLKVLVQYSYVSAGAYGTWPESQRRNWL
jgi:hypothetical protein